MFGSEVIDTAIGLIFVFLLVSMLVTIANELISAALLSRAKWLQFGVARLLGSDWAKKLYDHPLIEGNAVGEAADAPAAADDKRAWRGSGPSYISSRAFTDVLLHLVQREDAILKAVVDAIRKTLVTADQLVGTGAALHKAVLEAAAQAVPAGVSTAVVNDLARFLADRKDAFVTTLVGDLIRRAGLDGSASLQPLRDKLAALLVAQKDLTAADLESRLGDAIAVIPVVTGTDALIVDLQTMRARLHAGYTIGNAVADISRFIDAVPLRYLDESIGRIPNEKVRKTLRVLLDDAEHDVAHFKQNVEVWFNNSMDRVSGWYKRRSQWVAAGLSVVAAIGLNIDSMAIVDYLQTHASVRDALVAQAKSYSDANPTGPTTGQPVDATSFDDRTKRFEGVRSELSGLGLPVGWQLQPTTSKDTYHQVFATSTLGSAVGFHLLGWLMTALAATLGAPFWFDMLNRIISIRSAGKAPEEKPRPPKMVPLPLEPGQSPQEAEAADAVRGSRN